MNQARGPILILLIILYTIPLYLLFSYCATNYVQGSISPLIDKEEIIPKLVLGFFDSFSNSFVYLWKLIIPITAVVAVVWQSTKKLPFHFFIVLAISIIAIILAAVLGAILNDSELSNIENTDSLKKYISGIIENITVLIATLIGVELRK